MKRKKDISHLPPMDEFKNLYYQLKGTVQTDAMIANRDITPLLKKYRQDKIHAGELINMALRGEPGTGKSVVMLQFLLDINKELELMYDKKIEIYDMIAPDQTDFLRLVKGLDHVCVGIDEFNPMAQGGANASTESQEFQFYTDLCRVFYVHRVWCAPAKVIDPNCSVILDVQGKDIENKRTNVKILYRNPLEGQVVPLGSAWIDVSEVLDMEFYKKYEKKKVLRVNLLTKYGYRDRRTLEYGHIGLRIISDLKDSAHHYNVGELRQTISLKAVNYMEELYQRPVSWFTDDEIVKAPLAYLSSLIRMEKMRARAIKKKINITPIINMTKRDAKVILESLLKKQKVYEEYMGIQ